MEIIVTNDDGADAPGIHALAKVMAAFGNVSVIAPETNFSGTSHSLTLRKEVAVRRTDEGIIRVAGTPTDCVRLGYAGLLGHKPDIIISGINAGPNLSDDVLYSGTVAAAMEGRFLKFPALAISLAGRNPTHFETGAIFATEIMRHLISNPLPSGLVLNINISDILEQPFYQKCRGFALFR